MLKSMVVLDPDKVAAFTEDSSFSKGGTPQAGPQGARQASQRLGIFILGSGMYSTQPQDKVLAHIRCHTDFHTLR